MKNKRDKHIERYLKWKEDRRKAREALDVIWEETVRLLRVEKIVVFLQRVLEGLTKKKLTIKTLPRRYVDQTEVMLHAVFQCLVNFVELEEPENLDWDWCEEHAKVWEEIQELYKWWTKTRPARKDPFDDFDDSKMPPLGYRLRWEKEEHPEYEKAVAESNHLEVKWDEEDQRNLHRLIEIRGYLWI